jgi:enamine deaminase RidA (YjgF/YER057c/UK114 family)
MCFFSTKARRSRLVAGSLSPCWSALARSVEVWEAQAVGVIEERLAEMGLQLPAPLVAPPEVRLPFELVRVHGDLAYVSGHGPFDGDRLLLTGRVGGEVSVEQAYEAARATGLSILASLKQELGDLDRVTAWVKALGFVKCAEGFNVTPAVINGFGDLILTLWGEAGRHARSAIGAGELPFGMPVEVEAVVTLA